jgi:RNA polymerase sigma-70 factor (ECF subfamily)
VRLATEPTDEQLMLAFQRGDARAFEALVKRHRGAVFQFLLRSVGERGRAEDLLQETWLKVVRGAAAWEPRARFTTWVYTMARHLCVDESRRAAHRQPAHGAAGFGVEPPEGPPPSERVPDAAAAPDRAAHNVRLRPLLERALAGLPPEQREVFILREYSGIPFKDIAEVTGVPEPTVKSRMRYALEGLRAQLAALGVDGDMADEARRVNG